MYKRETLLLPGILMVKPWSAFNGSAYRKSRPQERGDWQAFPVQTPG